MKIIFVTFTILSVLYSVNCVNSVNFYCSPSNHPSWYLRFGIHTLAIHSSGCWYAAYVRNTCDIAFHNSEATIASIPMRERRKRQAPLGIFSGLLNSLIAADDRSGLSYPFDINQYVNSLPKNSFLYAIMTDARYANEGIPYCEEHLIAPLRRHQIALGGRQDAWYYRRADGSQVIIAFNKECPYTCLMH